MKHNCLWHQLIVVSYLLLLSCAVDNVIYEQWPIYALCFQHMGRKGVSGLDVKNTLALVSDDSVFV